MNDTEKIRIALIPAFQPDRRLYETARDLKEKGFNVIITDDGSGRKYRKIFSMAGKYASVISYPVNHGKGYALKTGIHYIMKKYSSGYVVVTVDADGQHSAEDAFALACASSENCRSLVIGSRRFDGKVPLRSRFGNTVTRIVFRVKSGVSVSDTQTGLRAFSSDLAEYITGIKGARYEYEMNMLMQCASDKVDIIEMPIHTIYIDDNSSSHFDPLKDSFRIYRSIFSFKNKKESD